MIPGMNPRKMNQMMRKMGISQQEIEATQVIIRTSEQEYIFKSPQVSKVNMGGQETYQIIGVPELQSLSSNPDISEEDIQTVMDGTGVQKEKALEAIQNCEGDLAQAILNLSNAE